MIKWLHQLLNPHCADCLLEESDNRVCNSCEILKRELALSHQHNRDLFDELTHKPEEVKTELVEMTKPIYTPWKAKRQMLEKEDRIRATALKNAAKANIEEIEKEIAN